MLKQNRIHNNEFCISTYIHKFYSTNAIFFNNVNKKCCSSFNPGKKLDDGKLISGTGRLTHNHIDKSQNFYGKAIHDNKDDAVAMSKANQAIWELYSTTPENTWHEDCPH